MFKKIRKMKNNTNVEAMEKEEKEEIAEMLIEDMAMARWWTTESQDCYDDLIQA